MCNWQGKLCSWLRFYLSQFLPGAIPISSGKNVYLTASQANIFIQKINVSNL